MDNPTPRIQRLVTRLSGPEAPGRPPAPLDPAVTEAAYRQALRRWFGLTAQGPSADGDQVGRVHQEILRLIEPHRPCSLGQFSLY